MSRLPLASLLILTLLAGCGLFEEEPAPGPLAIWVDPAATNELQRGSRTEPVHSIQAALDKAGAQTSRIYLADGEYPVNLTIDRAIILVGTESPYEDKPVLRAADPERPVLTVAEGTRTVGLLGLTLREGSQGVLVGNESALRMEMCAIEKNAGAAVAFMPAPDRRVETSSAQLHNVHIVDNGAGVEVHGKHAFAAVYVGTLRGNLGHAVSVAGGGKLNVTGCDIETSFGNGVHAALEGESKVDIVKCTIGFNGSDGIRLTADAEDDDPDWTVQITGNTFKENNGYGVAVIDTTTTQPVPDDTFKTITISGNQYNNNTQGLTAGILAD